MSTALKAATQLTRNGSGDDSELEASLRGFGMLQPIVTNKTGTVIIGERRRRVAARSGVEPEVRSIDVDDITALTMRLSEELSHAPIPDMERAEALLELRRRLKEAEEPHGDEALALRVHSTRNGVQKLLRFATAPKEVRQLLRTQQLTPIAANAIVRSGQLTEAEKVGLAKKVAHGLVPSAEREVNAAIKFATQATPRVRELVTTTPGVSLHEAKAAQTRSDYTKYRRDLEAEAPNYEALLWKAQKKLAEVTDALDLLGTVIGEATETRWRGMRREFNRLRDAMDTVEEKREKGRVPSPATGARVVRETEATWQSARLE